MGFRTVYITERSRCTYQNGYMVVRQEEQTLIHLSEIETVIFETTAAYISSYLLSELAQAKIPVLFCDVQHNPAAQSLPLYGAHDSARRVKEQIAWADGNVRGLWAEIVRNKIRNQAAVLESRELPQAQMLREYSSEVQDGDNTNREGHAAKVYFNALFGKSFYRDEDNLINAKLNYGYAILLASINREIAARGYLTSLGISHCNDYNQFNLACDLMEPFRPAIDAYVVNNLDQELDKEGKIALLGVFDEYFQYCGGHYRLSSILSMHVKGCLGILSERIALEDYMGFELNEV